MQKSSLLSNLLVFTGLAVLVGAIPLGRCAGVLCFNSGWPHLAVIVAAGILAAMILGGTLFVLGALASNYHGPTLNTLRNVEANESANETSWRHYRATG